MSFSHSLFLTLSLSLSDAVSLLLTLLSPNPKDRITVHEAMISANWFSSKRISESHKTGLEMHTWAWDHKKFDLEVGKVKL